jgi:hypothetical protein
LGSRFRGCRITAQVVSRVAASVITRLCRFQAAVTPNSNTPAEINTASTIDA